MRLDRSCDARKAPQQWSDKLLQRPPGSGGGGKWIVLGALLVGVLLIGLTIVALLALQDQREEAARAQATQNLSQLGKAVQGYAPSPDTPGGSPYLMPPGGPLYVPPSDAALDGPPGLGAYPPTTAPGFGPKFNVPDGASNTVTPPGGFIPSITDGALSPPRPHVPSGWGHLKGRFVVEGPLPELPALKITKNDDFVRQSNVRNESIVAGLGGELANVVVYLSIRAAAIHPDFQRSEHSKQSLRIERCRFEPRVSLVRAGQTLNVENADPIVHHAHVYTGHDVSSANADQGKRQTFRFDERTNVPALVECEERPWMRGWVLVHDSPYMAVTGKDGTFEIKNLPAGVELQFEAWHEIPGSADGGFTCLIQPDQTHDLGTVKIAADRLKPRRGAAARK